MIEHGAEVSLGDAVLKDDYKARRPTIVMICNRGRDLWSAELSCDRSQQDLHHSRLVETLLSTLLPLTHPPQHLRHQDAGRKGV